MRIPILRGRSFTDADRSTSQRVAVVSEAFVHRFFANRDPIGKRIGLCSADPCGVEPGAMIEIVGLARDAKYANVRETHQPMLYLPFTQQNQSLRELEVRTAGAPAALAATLRAELAEVDRRLATVSTIELREQVDASLVGERLTAKLSAAFGLLALALAAIGLYGVVAYATLERTAEIGLRMALGADRRQVRRLVVRDVLWLVAIGIGIGLPAALMVTQLLESQLYAITSTDPVALIATLGTLIAAALLAGYLPTRRATRVDPLIALRAE
jgi:predicted permease